MIELLLTGTVEVESSYSHSGSDGRADYTVENTLRQTVEVEARKEFPDGYVNLEGYVLSAYHTTENDMLHSFHVPDNEGLDNWKILEDSADLEVEMHGDKFDWLDQALRYISERPNLSVVGALEKFKGWDETDGDTLDGAIRMAQRVDNADTPTGGLSTEEYRQLITDYHNMNRGMKRRDVLRHKPDKAEA